MTRTSGRERKAITEIANKVLYIPLETHGRDGTLSFSSLAVWRIEEALKAAYRAGRSDAKDGAS